MAAIVGRGRDVVEEGGAGDVDEPFLPEPAQDVQGQVAVHRDQEADLPERRLAVDARDDVRLAGGQLQLGQAHPTDEAGRQRAEP